MNDDAERDAEAVGGDVLESLAGVIAVGTLGVGVTSAVLGYGGLTAPIFVVGWLLLLPLVGVLSESSMAQSFVGRLLGAGTRERDRQELDDESAALEELKRRYARGELDEAEFERRTALLLENESIDDVRDRVDRTGARDVERRERDRAATEEDATVGRERERDPEYET
jgi:uncharacterized membrane protein